MRIYSMNFCKKCASYTRKHGLSCKLSDLVTIAYKRLIAGWSRSWAGGAYVHTGFVNKLSLSNSHSENMNGNINTVNLEKDTKYQCQDGWTNLCEHPNAKVEQVYITKISPPASGDEVVHQ